jgi:hypothetical protein
VFVGSVASAYEYRCPHLTPTINVTHTYTYTATQFFDGERVRLYIVHVMSTPLGDDGSGDCEMIIRFDPAPPSR